MSKKEKVPTSEPSPDITERKRAEEALQESETKFKMIVENIRDVVFQLSPLGFIQYVSPKVEEVYGYKPEDLIGKHFKKTTPKSELPKALSAVKSVLSGKVINNLEINQLDSKGKIIPMEINATPVRREGKIIAVQGIMRDVTERKQAEEALRRAHDKLEIRVQERTEELARTNEVLQAEITERKQMEEALRQSEEKYRTILEEMEDAYFEVDLEGNYTFVNDQHCRVLGYSMEEMIGMNTRAVTAEEDFEYMYNAFSQAYQTGEPIRNLAYRMVGKDGKIGWAEVSAVPMRNQQGEIIGFRGIGRNVTERKRMEEALRETQEQLVRSEKLAAIGQLAGGVGHELRNPLGAIRNAVYYVRGKVAKSELGDKEPRVMEFLAIIDDEINSSSKIIDDLLGFSRVSKPVVSPARIEKVIEDALSYTTIPENIKLTKKLDTDLPEVKIDTDQVRQVLVNMILNAVQAMPTGGKLTISAREKNKFLEVEITDTGCGIPQEVMDKIFDPLFTTRAKGIGLGLAVCKAIIDRHQGYIEVESKVGKRTTFTIKLPPEAE